LGKWFCGCSKKENSDCRTTTAHISLSSWKKTFYDMEEGFSMANKNKHCKKGENPKDRLGVLKVDLSLVPPIAIVHCATGMMDGARKYDPYNWRKNNVKARIYVAAAMRHLLAWLDGEEVASDSKVHHLGHVMACCAILLDAQEGKNLEDDRPIKGTCTKVLSRLNSRIKKHQMINEAVKIHD